MTSQYMWTETKENSILKTLCLTSKTYYWMVGSSTSDLVLLSFYYLAWNSAQRSTNKLSWDREGIEQKETQLLLREKQPVGQKQQLRAQKLILSHKEELLSRAPRAAPCSQKAPSKGISTASVLLCDWAVTLISVYSKPAVVISVVVLTHTAGSLLFMPCVSVPHHPDWGAPSSLHNC